MAEDAIIGIQDMGAAGLTSSSVEMAGKSGVGIDLDLDHVPCREDGMTAYEMLLSESQERMLMVLKPGREHVAQRIFEKWGLDFAIIGETTDTGRLIARHHGEIVADLPVDAVSNEAPVYERPWTPTPKAAALDPNQVPASNSASADLARMMGSPDMCSRRWVWEQYDHMVMADTVARPGGDAALVRVHGTNKGVAITTDVTPRYVAADPHEGGKQAVAEAWRNLTATGAKPLAITDCLNFGNPERPEIMGQFAGAVEGMAQACRALDFPVVSGNVSFYNETNGTGILPTPAVGGVGLVPDIARRATIAARGDTDTLVLIGAETGHLGQSLYLRDVLGRTDGPPPPVDLDAERANGDFVRGLITDGTVDCVHDCSDGGLYAAIAEMALAGRIGADVNLGDTDLPAHALLFGEDQARYVIACPAATAKAILARAGDARVPARLAGTVGGDRLTVNGVDPISLQHVAEAHAQWLPRYMNGR
jgi:phosphoribosylformylglycinamidine synthase